MPTLTQQTQQRGSIKTDRAVGTNKAIAWLGDVMAAVAGTASGEDALSVLNRKLEESNLIGHGTGNPTTPPDATEPWIYVDTDDNKVWIKEETGGNFDWTGPLFEGQHRTELVYNAQDTPGNLSVQWNYQSDTFSPSGGGWSGNSTNAKWVRFVTLERNTNNYVVSPAISLESGGTGGTDDQTAAEVSTNTGNFNNNLSSANTNVQSALDTLDDIDFPPEQKASWPSRSGAVDATGISQTFTVIPALISERTTYGEGIFIEAEADIRMQADSGAAGDTATFVLDIVTGPSDASTGVESDPVTLTESAGAVPATLRLTGILPAGFTTGKLRVRRSAQVGTTPATAFEGFRLQMRLSVMADEVIVDQEDLGNNLTGDSDNLEEIISEVDELPIAIGSDFEDVAFPGRPNGIDDNAMLDSKDEATGNRRTISFHKNLQDANSRPDITYIAQITYNATEIGTRTDGQTGVNYTHYIYSNTVVANRDVSTQIQSTNESTGTTAQPKSHVVIIPNGTLSIDVRIASNSNQGDARLLITDYQVTFLQGIDASGFTSGNLTTTDNTVQDLAQKFNDYTPSAVSIDASGFGGTGNLATTDDTVQEVANKFNAYVPMPTAANTSIANPTSSNTFYDPNNVIGGIRGYPGLVANPANVRDALRSIDRRLADAYNPFQSTQLLDRTDGAGISHSDFTINSATDVYTNEVDIPQELRELGTDVDIRIRLRIRAISAFVGDIGLTISGTTNIIPGTTIESVTDNVYNPNQYVTFERTISAANVPNTFRVRFRRTAGSATFDQGFADVIDSDGGGAMGGAGGQSAGYTSNIIWLAGASINDRLTIASETTNYTLMSGHNFSDYDQIVFVFDGGSGANQPLMPMWVDANLFQAFGAGGTLWIMGNWWLMVSRQSDNTFRFRWRGANNGLRRIIGISTG